MKKIYSIISKKNYGDTNFITGIRGIAALAVFLIHSGGGGLRELCSLTNRIVDSGKLGVHIFFVISGFTIYHQLLSKKYTIKEFLLIRVLRISIPYWPILILFYLTFGILEFEHFLGWSQKFNNSQIDISNFISHILYFSSYNLNWQNTIIGVEWSLGIEIFFYFIFAIFCYFNLLKPKIYKIIISIFILILMHFLAKKSISYLNLPDLFYHWAPFKYGYIFFIGGMAYYVRNIQIKNIFNSDLIIIGLFISTLLLINYSNFKIVETFIILSTALLISLINKKNNSYILTNKFILYIGNISYSFYLIHFPIILLLPKTKIAFVDFIIALFFTVIISSIWFVLFEDKIYNNIRKRITIANKV